ncbi:MAG: hypothetical protein FWG73_04000 [Planctomycetaceae bacterium]|nr:hypothetical protein [Planctomycetaceae bacterium]
MTWKLLTGCQRTGKTSASHSVYAGKKINGIRRHIAVDTLGLLLAVENYRRLCRNYECWTETSEAVVKMAMILVMLRRLA